ncbi:uncharacterized protein LOC106654327 [Trichogramma pretiosum]|uniref:uncharacterized protein LOC106654327 n=1 Tax=Trichogramma pretiosum TaxID=7493 RepID=UPI0006C95B05|nr:uncharacterized protein LOC106654327 [Trichogramma pretiosum]
MTFTWTDPKVVALIEEVEKYPTIWNLKHPDHKKQKVLSSIWSKIATTVGVGKLQARNKWRTLATTFKSEHAKYKINLPSGSAATFEPEDRWNFYDDMSFMIPCIEMEMSGNINLSFHEIYANQPTSHGIVSSSVQHPSTSCQNQWTSWQNQLTSGQNLSTSGQNLSTSGQNQSTSSKSMPNSLIENEFNVTNNISTVMPQASVNGKADWKFLESLDYYMNLIDDPTTKYQFCLEVSCSLFNILQKNKEKTEDQEKCVNLNNIKMRETVDNNHIDSINKKRPISCGTELCSNLNSIAMEQELSDQCEPDNRINVMNPDNRRIENQPERDNGKIDDQSEHNNNRIDDYYDDDDIMIIDEIKPVQKKRKVEIEPTQCLQSFLKNPFEPKKEFKSE